MARSFTPTSWFWLLAISLASTVAAATQPAMDDSPEKTPALRGHLPAYYRQVVSEEQRMEIYRIQAEYQEKLDALQNRWKMLKQERDEKIASVLTEEQKKRVEKAIAEAKAQRAAKTKKPLVPAGNAPTYPPANQ